MQIKRLVLVVLLMGFSLVNAGVLNKKGKTFFYHGWNHSTYSNSDIHFSGPGYDYTLYDVSARDSQSPVNSDYLTNPTMPQTNVKLGYFISDNESISLGLDHMKYVVRRVQDVLATGTDHQGTTHDNTVISTDGLILYEHTDGLNYLNVSYEHSSPLWESDSKKNALSFIVGGALGLMYPRTNVTLVGASSRYDEFRLSGYGADIHLAAELDFLTDFFFRVDAKVGYIDLPWVATGADLSHSASQSVFFAEYIYSVGLYF